MEMNLADEKFAGQLIAELLDANEQAFAVLTLAVADVVGHEPLGRALIDRLTKAQAELCHPIRDGMLKSAVAMLVRKH